MKSTVEKELVVSLLTVDVEARGKLSTERETEQWMRSKSLLTTVLVPLAINT